MQQAPRDEDLERFDRLCVEESRPKDGTISFQAEFQTAAAASLEYDEWITVEVKHVRKIMAWLKVVLADPQADKVCSLRWLYKMKEDENHVLPHFTDSWPKLALLRVVFRDHSLFDFVSGVLEHPSNRIKVLHMPQCTEGDIPRFFAALEQSQVSALTLSGVSWLNFAQGLYEYLAKDLLVRLKVDMGNGQVPLAMMLSLASCTCLTELELNDCNFSQPNAFTNLPKSIAKLKLSNCILDGVDWSFLADSNLQELDFYDLSGVDGKELGGALAVLLKANGLDKLCFSCCDFADEILAVVGMEICRIKELNAHFESLNAASIELISRVLQSPNSEIVDLRLQYEEDTASSIENHLVRALRHPNCILNKLSFYGYLDEHEAAAKMVEDTFRNRRALFALLQAKRKSPLRRLPVEMFRLVGMVLM